MYPPDLDFQRLKSQVSLERVLALRGLLGKLRARGRSLVGPCPLHGGDNPSAFVVDLDKNLWNCFTRCGRGGDLVDFVRLLDRLSYRQTALYLAAIAAPFGSTPAASTAPTDRRPFQPFVHRLCLQHDNPFLAAKAIRPTTAARFEAGRYLGRGFLQGCIAVRLHDSEARPLGYAGRRLDSEQAARLGKWKFPPRLPRSQLLYNFHRVRPPPMGTLVLTECPWAVMRLDQLDIPAVALLGIHLSSAQHQLLRSASSCVVLLLDGDSAGRAAATRIHYQLLPTLDVQVVDLPDGSDPDDLQDDDLRQRLSLFLS
jgi:DNA primase